MTETTDTDPFEIAAFQCKAALAMARRVSQQSPNGYFDEHEVWFHAQAFGSAFTSVMDAIDNVSKRHGQAVILIVETWKNENRQDYYDLAATVRNRMQHGGLRLYLRSEWIDENDFMNDTTHRVQKHFFAEIKRKGEEAELVTIGEWAVYIFNWWQDQIDQLYRLYPRAKAWHDMAQESLGRPLKYPKINEAKSKKKNKSDI